MLIGFAALVAAMSVPGLPERQMF